MSEWNAGQVSRYDPRTGNPWLRGWLTMVYAIARPLARRGVQPDVLTISAIWLAGAVFVPADAAIEGGSRAEPDPEEGDRHVLAVRSGTCDLIELYAAERVRDSSGTVVAWRAAAAARWDLSSNRLRPATWTSADAAGLPYRRNESTLPVASLASIHWKPAGSTSSDHRASSSL